jgi:probable HAF family extracellular repeat protein
MADSLRALRCVALRCAARCGRVLTEFFKAMTRTILQAATVLALLLPAAQAAAQTYKFKTTVFNKTSNTFLEDSNNQAKTVGNYEDASGHEHCFTISGSRKTLLTDPNGAYTQCFGISKGGINKAAMIVGNYENGNGVGPGFIYANGAFSDVTPAGAVFAIAEDVNDAGAVIGTWVDNGGSEHAFLFSGGKYTSIDAKGATVTVGIGINNAGAYTLQTYDAEGNLHSYFVEGSKTTELAFPGASETRAQRLNNKGLVALEWMDGDGNEHGGLYDSTTGKYTQVDVPKALFTAVLSVNDQQELTGFYDLAVGGFRGFTASVRMR